MKKKFSIFVLMTIMLFAMTFHSSADEVKKVPLASDEIYRITPVESAEMNEKSAATASIKAVRVFPYNGMNGYYYQPYTDFVCKGQWCNGTLSTASATSYMQNNCDGYYLLARIDPSSARTYEMYINNVLVGKGNVPVGPMNLELLISNQNPGRWKLVLYDLGDSVGIPLWGSINLN